MKRFIIAVLVCTALIADAQQNNIARPWSQQMAETVMKTWPDSFSTTPGRRPRWSYDHGVMLKGIEAIWNNTGDAKWFNYIQKMMDFYVQPDGSIFDYHPGEYNIDHINNGKLLLLLYRVNGKEKYKKAVDLLREQLRSHPRTNEGGYWHKQVYPYQMWLDGLYMGQPFYAEYAKVFHDDTAFNDIANQFIYMERHSRDAKTGLLYHGWDESKQQQWANKETGLSPHFWGRALGWYGMAMVDVLDHFPVNHPGRDSIIGILNRFVKAVTKVQDPASGVWYDIVDLPKREKNYKEASASCMLVYTIAKAVRNGYIPASYIANAKKGYDGIVKEFIRTENGQVNLHGTVSVSGLGGKPYRDGSFEYYMREKVVVNDPKGVGAFIKCSAEMEMIPAQSTGKGKTVLLDRYFNSEKRKDVTGTPVYWHYVWDEKSHPGFSMLGDIFKRNGANLASLDNAPTAANLKNVSVYIIVDPDHGRDNPTPNYVEDKDIKPITDWVKAGGVLLLMANDSNNCDLSHFNKLAGAFGMTFTDKSRNMVKNDEFETGAVMATAGNGVFRPKKMYLKEISILDVKSPAKTLLSKNGETVIATAKYGKGVVFAVGDPWLYNEYIDGRKALPAEFKNYEAAEDLVKWLLTQGKK
jgi:unsaturated rhamnogalacturonyl hydrolase